ncbi:MAG: 2-oxoglutarate dehydrogenase E1 component [Acidobacteria bacterium]|nr:MAG: 2-oxoglutarate dehydrogenase E1 component [Acidobacteriota bacterium]
MADDPLADGFRRWGYLQADLDPLGRLKPIVHPDLEKLSGPSAKRWRSIYCGPIGVEFQHIHYPDRCRWVAEHMEKHDFVPDRRRIVERLAQAELFERFLHTRFVGTKRYSLEGAASLITLLDSLLDAASSNGSELALLAMSHRGRLNVMRHVVGVSAASIFAEFEDVDPKSVLGGGDVRYHQGSTGEYIAASGRTLRMHLVSNPSHLEAVDSVMILNQAEEDNIQVCQPTTAGQGIAAETLNLADLPGFTVGGTVHVIVNNLIGFTTPPEALHSTRYSSDVARRLPIPIFHVNGQEPEAVARVGRIALAFRAAFHTDVVVDLIGFRRYGHSEVDDPTTTQPVLYRKIEALPMLWQAYAKQIDMREEDTQRLQGEIREQLQAELEKGRAMRKKPVLRRLPEYWDPFRGGLYEPSLEVETAVSASRLGEIARRLCAVPDNFQVHAKVRKGLDQRREMGAAKRPVDWGMAEALAFASLLGEGTPVRLSGQDSRRGTFNQRHAVLIDTHDGHEHVPLNHLGAEQGRFEVVDSPLSEASILGFEYGYSRDYPDALVCWEAQFGDFANGSQIIIDQFLVAGEDKWGLLSGLVMLLPHGYEGQGPDHSSARVERFLNQAEEDNIQVCQPTTAGQYFHLLRRQALRKWRKPLIVLTPKGLLRAPTAASPLEHLTGGRFHPVLPDEGSVQATRVLICTGKIAHELLAGRAERKAHRTAIVRLEQLYPFPGEELAQELRRHSRAREIVWVQEEPGNMGALRFVRPRLESIAGGRPVRAVNRSESASPATGSAKAHALEQATLLILAFAPLSGDSAA